MNWLVLILISLNLLLGYFVFLGINNNGRHLGLNRWYLIGFPIFSIVVGLVYHFSEGSVLKGFVINIPLIEATVSNQTSTIESTFAWSYWIYISGVVVSLILFAVSLWKVRKPAGAKFLNRSGQQTIYLISDKRQSFSHFNSIYISEYQLDNVDFILKHELAHCRQKHSLDLIFIRLIRSLFWFHPTLYLWELKMKENHEYLADRASISKDDEVQPYSYALLASHFGVAIPDLANGFNRKSLLQKRIIQLKTQNKIHMKQLILVPAILVGVVLTMSIQLESNVLTPKNHTIENDKGDIDKNPEFIGGSGAMVSYLQENLKYPKDLAKQKLEAKVYVKFVVSKSGKVKDVSILRGSEHIAFNQEATRVISNMPNWTPGVKDGKTVSGEVTIPIQFNIAK